MIMQPSRCCGFAGAAGADSRRGGALGCSLLAMLRLLAVLPALALAGSVPLPPHGRDWSVRQPTVRHYMSSDAASCLHETSAALGPVP
eukprot:COSAG06_NODE_1793_length_8391_cov_49.730134_10_plen_88_part_00